MGPQKGFLKERCLEGEEDEKICQQGIHEVNGEVHDVVARDIGAVEFIVEGKGEVCDVPLPDRIAVPVFCCLGRSDEMPEVLYDGIALYESDIVPLERNMEGVRVGDEAEDEDNKDVNEGPFGKWQSCW